MRSKKLNHLLLLICSHVVVIVFVSVVETSMSIKLYAFNICQFQVRPIVHIPPRLQCSTSLLQASFGADQGFSATQRSYLHGHQRYIFCDDHQTISSGQTKWIGNYYSSILLLRLWWVGKVLHSIKNH